MTPAGIERDKQIAEMRGDCRHLDILKVGTQQHCPDCNKFFTYHEFLSNFINKPKPYSTDISCAFELWEEMKAAGCNIHLHYNNPNVEPSSISGIAIQIWDGGTVKMGNAYNWLHGETEADAISGAWLLWQEGK